MARSQIVSNNFTQGSILKPLLRFSLPILLALILQTAYGAVDLWMVSTYATAAEGARPASSWPRAWWGPLPSASPSPSSWPGGSR